MDGLHFRAVFSYQGQTVTTADNGVAVNGYNGILTVRRKMVVTNGRPNDLGQRQRSVYFFL